MGSGIVRYLPVPEQRAVVDALVRGPISNPDGSVSCPACPNGRTFNPARYMTHRYASHIRFLDRVHSLELPGVVGCDHCSETMLATSMPKHLRDVHGLKQRRTHAEIERAPRARPRRASSNVVELPTPTDAGLAILAGLAPGGSIPVEQLHDIVDWLATTERIVGIARGREP